LFDIRGFPELSYTGFALIISFLDEFIKNSLQVISLECSSKSLVVGVVAAVG
jgi:hypothetical protein